jgi:hypothetical protein
MHSSGNWVVTNRLVSLTSPDYQGPKVCRACDIAIFPAYPLELCSLALGLHFGLTHSGFELQKGQLLVRKFLASCHISRSAPGAAAHADSDSLILRPVVFLPALKPHRRFSQIFNQLLAARSSQQIDFQTCGTNFIGSPELALKTVLTKVQWRPPARSSSTCLYAPS